MLHTYRVAKKLDFYDIEILETLERGLEVRQQGTRPKTRMVGHSGYLLFARKLWINYIHFSYYNFYF